MYHLFQNDPAASIGFRKDNWRIGISTNQHYGVIGRCKDKSAVSWTFSIWNSEDGVWWEGVETGNCFCHSEYPWYKGKFYVFLECKVVVCFMVTPIVLWRVRYCTYFLITNAEILVWWLGNWDSLYKWKYTHKINW